jgi:hypothetical protein
MTRLEARPQACDERLNAEWQPVVRWRALSAKVIVVARTRIEGRWAAYIDAVPGKDHYDEYAAVLDYGAKLEARIARALFPMFDEVPYAD